MKTKDKLQKTKRIHIAAPEIKGNQLLMFTIQIVETKWILVFKKFIIKSKRSF